MLSLSLIFFIIFVLMIYSTQKENLVSYKTFTEKYEKPYQTFEETVIRFMNNGKDYFSSCNINPIDLVTKINRAQGFLP